MTVGLRGASPNVITPGGAVLVDGGAAVLVDGRRLSRSDRVKALRRALRKAEGRLERSMAHRPDPWPRDLERWDAMRREIAVLQNTLAAVLAGRTPPLSSRTGEKTRELPDAVT